MKRQQLWCNCNEKVASRGQVASDELDIRLEHSAKVGSMRVMGNTVKGVCEDWWS
jgi:hypothetical protein